MLILLRKLRLWWDSGFIFVRILIVGGECAAGECPAAAAVDCPLGDGEQHDINIIGATASHTLESIRSCMYLLNRCSPLWAMRPFDQFNVTVVRKVMMAELLLVFLIYVVIDLILIRSINKLRL